MISVSPFEAVLRVRLYNHRGSAASLDDAIRGGCGVAAVRAVPPELASHLVFALYLRGDPGRNLGAALSEVWELKHRDLVALAERHGRSLPDLFRAAGHQLQPDFPPTVRVWRGVAGVDARLGAAGRSWTLEREFACAWAMVMSEGGLGKPLVLTRLVKRDQVFYHRPDPSNEVLIEGGGRVRVDGDEADWRAAQETYRRIGRVRLDHIKAAGACPTGPLAEKVRVLSATVCGAPRGCFARNG